MSVENFINTMDSIVAEGQSVSTGLEEQKNSAALNFIRAMDSIGTEEKVEDDLYRGLRRPSLADPLVQTFPTTLETTFDQNVAELRAVSEYNRMLLQARGMGKEEELLDYIERSGRVDGLAQLDYEGEGALDTIFDVLNAGNYATAAFTDELIKSGSASEAFNGQVGTLQMP